MSEQTTDGFEQWWKTLQADPRRPTAVATMSKKTARAGWSAALAQAERAKSAEQTAFQAALSAERQARERAEAGWAEANQRLKDGPDHPPHCDHQMGCHVQETAWMRDAADARAALAACEARLTEANQKIEDVLDDAWHWQKRAMMAGQMWAYYEPMETTAPPPVEETA